jgi:Leucine-rich repeat (LRR) protein
MEAMKKKQIEQQFQIQKMLESQQNQFNLLKQRPEIGGHTQQQKIGVETKTGGLDEDGRTINQNMIHTKSAILSELRILMETRSGKW